MISREEIFMLSLDERDELRTAISKILKQLEFQVSQAVTLWTENFDTDFYFPISHNYEEDINWDSFFRRADNMNEISIFIQRKDFQVWLLASALQTLIIRHRAITSFFIVADFLRVARENELNAPRL